MTRPVAGIPVFRCVCGSFLKPSVTDRMTACPTCWAGWYTGGHYPMLTRLPSYAPGIYAPRMEMLRDCYLGLQRDLDVWPEIDWEAEDAKKEQSGG